MTETEKKVTGGAVPNSPFRWALVFAVAVLAVGALVFLSLRPRGAEGPAPQFNAEKPTSEQLDAARDSGLLAAQLMATPDDVDALVALAALELDAGEETRPVDRLQRAVSLTADPRRLVNAGLLLARVARTELAVEAFEKALDSDPGDTQTLYRAGLLAWKNLGDHERGARHWRRYLELAPGTQQASMIRQAMSVADGKK